MKGLVLVLVGFVVSLVVVGAILFDRAQHAVAGQERAELAFFANTLLDRMDEELLRLVLQEEARAPREYRSSGAAGGPSSLVGAPTVPYVIGYLVDHADGSYSSPMDLGRMASQERADEIRARLARSHAEFRGTMAGAPPAPTADAKPVPPPGSGYLALEERYLRSERGIGKKREDAANPDRASRRELEAAYRAGLADARTFERDLPSPAAAPAANPDATPDAEPLRAALLDDDTVFLFRSATVAGETQRQGVLLSTSALLRRLTLNHFTGQPIERFTRLVLAVQREGVGVREETSGVDADLAGSALRLERPFSRPFEFITARLLADATPPSPGRTTLGVLIVAFVAVALLGGAALARAVHGQNELALRRTRFVSSVTHELKTPLTAIGMYIEMLELGMDRDGETRERYFQVLKSETARLSRLIHRVLEFSRLETRNHRLVVGPGDLVAALREAERVMSEQARQGGFVLSVMSPEHVEATFDPEAVVQILVNLIENSIKFGAASVPRQITLFAASGESEVSFGVADLGPGISPRTLRHLFDDFYRGDDPVTRQTKGTGIGLALVRRLAGAMGGRVEARNNPTAGCTLTVTLPNRALNSPTQLR